MEEYEKGSEEDIVGGYLLRATCFRLGDVECAKGDRGDGGLSGLRDKLVAAFAFQLFGVLGCGGSLVPAASRTRLMRSWALAADPSICSGARGSAGKDIPAGK